MRARTDRPSVHPHHCTPIKDFFILGGVPNPTVTADYGQDLADTEAEELEINDHRVHQTVAQLSNEERSSKGNRLVLMHAFIVRRNSAPS